MQDTPDEWLLYMLTSFLLLQLVVYSPFPSGQQTVTMTNRLFFTLLPHDDKTTTVCVLPLLWAVAVIPTQLHEWEGLGEGLGGNRWNRKWCLKKPQGCVMQVSVNGPE